MEQRFQDLLVTYQVHIARYGWTAIATTLEDRQTFVTYSAGFRDSVQHPDILITRLPPQVAHQTIQQIYNLIKIDGMRFVPDSEYTEVANIPVRFVQLTDAWKQHMMVQTYNVYGDWTFEALQVIFPDKAGRWPGEPGWVKEQSAWPLMNRDDTAGS